jgi:hypothetical protein
MCLGWCSARKVANLVKVSCFVKYSYCILLLYQCFKISVLFCRYAITGNFNHGGVSLRLKNVFTRLTTQNFVGVFTPTKICLHFIGDFTPIFQDKQSMTDRLRLMENSQRKIVLLFRQMKVSLRVNLRLMHCFRHIDSTCTLN